MQSRRRVAFTLIELLVVVSIIALLIAILLPALGSARKSAKDILCRANLKQLAVSNHAFAADFKGESPPRSDNGLSSGMFAIWRKGNPWNNAQMRGLFGQYRRTGVLMSEGYSDSPEILYCPSMSEVHEWLRAGELRSDRQYSGYMDDNERPTSVVVMNMSYHYRETYPGQEYAQGRTVPTNKMSQVLNMTKHPTDLVLVSDAFSDPGRGIKDGHQDGYNFARLDGSGDWFQDRDQQIDNFGGGSAWNTNVRKVERAYESFRWGEVVGDDLNRP